MFDILLFPLQNDCKDFPDEDIGNITYDVEDNTFPSFDWTYTAVALLVTCLAAWRHITITGAEQGKKTELSPNWRLNSPKALCL